MSELISDTRQRGVIFTMLMAGCITVAVTTMFGADKNAVIATIVGYSSLLIGMMSVVAYAFQYGLVTMNKNITFVVICAIIMVLIFINLFLFSKYINEISLGYVPYLEYGGWGRREKRREKGPWGENEVGKEGERRGRERERREREREERERERERES
jgi:membrane associated rhomboid family serine protease